MRWIFNRGTGRALLWMLLVIAVVTIVNVMGVRVTGSIVAWRQWMDDAKGYFFVWRLCIYSALVYGWLWMRRRVLSREPESKASLIRTEIAGIVAIVVVELSMFVQPA
jgi:hypothetical protein